MTYAEQQQKAKENFEKSIRKVQRTLKRFITVFKYLNQEQNNFEIKYLKPDEKALIRRYYQSSSPKRFLETFIFFPEKKVKGKFLNWLIRKSSLDMYYGIGMGMG